MFQDENNLINPFLQVGSGSGEKVTDPHPCLAGGSFKSNRCMGGVASVELKIFFESRYEK